MTSTEPTQAERHTWLRAKAETLRKDVCRVVDGVLAKHGDFFRMPDGKLNLTKFLDVNSWFDELSEGGHEDECWTIHNTILEWLIVQGELDGIQYVKFKIQHD